MQGPLVALAFKLEEGRFGQLTYMRIYSGTVRKGDPIVNATTGKRIKVCLLPSLPGPSSPNKEVTQLEHANIGQCLSAESSTHYSHYSHPTSKWLC